MCWQLDKLECSKIPVPTKGVYFLSGTGKQYHIVLSATYFQLVINGSLSYYHHLILIPSSQSLSMCMVADADGLFFTCSRTWVMVLIHDDRFVCWQKIESTVEHTQEGLCMGSFVLSFLLLTHSSAGEYISLGFSILFF